MDDIVRDAIDSKQFGGIAGTSTTNALVEMTHRWYEATHILNTYVRVVMLDFSKAFDLINHHILLEKLTNSGLPRHIVRWIGAFLLDRSQKVMIGSNCSRSGSPNGGVPLLITYSRLLLLSDQHNMFIYFVTRARVSRHCCLHCDYCVTAHTDCPRRVGRYTDKTPLGQNPLGQNPLGQNTSRTKPLALTHTCQVF